MASPMTNESEDADTDFDAIFEVGFIVLLFWAEGLTDMQDLLWCLNGFTEREMVIFIRMTNG